MCVCVERSFGMVLNILHSSFSPVLSLFFSSHWVFFSQRFFLSSSSSLVFRVFQRAQHTERINPLKLDKNEIFDIFFGLATKLTHFSVRRSHDKHNYHKFSNECAESA